MTIVFSASAEADLEAIGDYIALDNPRRAISFVGEIRERIAGLAEFPRAYPVVPRHQRHGFRRIVHGNDLIFYTIMPDAIEIVRILNGAVDYEPILFPDGKPDS